MLYFLYLDSMLVTPPSLTDDLYEDEELGKYDIIKSNTLQIMLDHS